MTITLPEAPEQLVDLLNDSRQLTQLIKDGKFGDAMKAYSDAVMSADGDDVTRQLREQVQLGIGEFLKAHGASLPQGAVARSAEMQIRGPQVSSARRALYNRHAKGNAAEGIFEDGADFLQAVAAAAGRGTRTRDVLDKLARLQQVQNSYGSEVPADGGFLIPETLRSQILEVALEEDIIRSRATVIPMDSLRVPVPTIDDTSHVSNIFGGVQCYWTEESQPITESQASFARVVLDAKKLAAYAAIPNELLADAPAFAGFFDGTFPRAIAWFEDLAFIAGTGAAEPQGFINCQASVAVAAEPGQPTKTIVWENLTQMWSRLLPTSMSRAIWIANLDTFRQLATMALSVGTGGSAVWIGNFQTAGSASPPVSILGRPVIFTEKVPTLGTTGDICLLDPSYYLIGDRMQMQSMVSEHFLFSTDKTAYRIIERVDGRPWLQSAIVPHSGSANTLTPFVQLATR